MQPDISKFIQFVKDSDLSLEDKALVESHLSDPVTSIETKEAFLVEFFHTRISGLQKQEEDDLKKIVDEANDEIAKIAEETNRELAQLERDVEQVTVDTEKELEAVV